MTGKKLTGKRRDSIRVCYLIDVAPDFYTGGGQAHLTNLVREFKRSDLAAARLPAWQAGSDLIIFGGQNPNIIFRFFWMLYVIPQVVFYHLFRQKFSLIHAHSVPAMAAGKVISIILGIPIVATVHGTVISDKDSPCRPPLLSTRLLRELFVHGSWGVFRRAGTARRVLSRFFEEWILTKIKYSAQITVSQNFLEVPNVNKNLVYIPNGVDASVFQGLSLRPQGESLSDKKILFVGRKNDPVKGFRVLEKAMKLIKQEIPEAKLLVADGSVSRDEVIKMYLRADLFVLPSLSEGFPLTLLEAWAARLPVVATAVGEVSYIVDDGVNGYLVPPGEAESLAEAITVALKNPGLAKLGENGYNLVKRFNWDLVARKTMRVYNAVLVKER